MLKDYILSVIKKKFNANRINRVDLIQKLWSDYGKIERIFLEGGEVDSLIVKHIFIPKEVNHPKGWNTPFSHIRKLKSYQIEIEWYKNWSALCYANCRIPKYYGSETKNGEHNLILEDLNTSGFPLRKSSLTLEGANVVIQWLAHFHATFLGKSPEKLWKEGTYWHLDTRPDELASMKEGALKSNAYRIDKFLSNCQFQTILHGDAKVANFCFSDDMKAAAAVDFQYVGGGCGMKDFVYFLGSCFSAEQCERYDQILLNSYFQELQLALNKHKVNVDFVALEKEWRGMYEVAWADFVRFLKGWMPAHQKINFYSLKMVEMAIRKL